MNYIILALLLYCVAREVWYFYTVNTLLNKLMSRNYHDYTFSKSAGTIKQAETPSKIEGFEDEPEDLGTLDDFTR